MIIGVFGPVIFSVSSRMVRTFNNMQMDSSVNYATHDRHLQTPMIEYTGENLNSLPFEMHFLREHNVLPWVEIAKLQALLKSGRAWPLVVGLVPIGKHRWVVTDLKVTFERFDNWGRLREARVSVSLLQAPRR